jgi:hypothetical protein
MASGTPETGDSGEIRRLTPLFLLIVVIEVVTVAALYWFGRHFGPA